MNSANIYATLALSGLISLLAGCDGDEQDKAALALDTSSSMATASSVASVNSNSSSTITIEDCSLYPGAPACYIIKDSECLLENCEPDYRVMDACGVSKLPKNLEASMIEGNAFNCGPTTPISSSSATSSSTPTATACETLEGRTYFTDTLEESGRGVNSVAMHHWSISFKKGELNLRQSDFGLIGTYSCQGDQVIATINHGSSPSPPPCCATGRGT